MKITCDFCKTEYSLDRAPVTPVRCAICGHVWRVPRATRRNTWLTFITALCALLAAMAFAGVVLTRHQIQEIQRTPIVATVSGLETVTGDDGVERFVVSGTVQNRSDEIYGVPDLIIVSYDDDDNVIARQKFMPSATLLDPGASVSFSHTLNAPTSGIKKVGAVLDGFDTGDAK